jgi:hypothetical protein
LAAIAICRTLGKNKSKMRWPVLFLALAVWSCGPCTPSSSAAPFVPSAIYSGQESIPIATTCTVEVSPDQAIIVGGVSSSSVEPADAVGQLEKELDLMKTYIAKKHGEIQMLERVRTLKNPQPGRAETEPPYQIVQRLQITLPTDAPVDEILQKLIELGFDRFGENVMIDTNRREAVVRYRVSDFDAKMKDFQQRCTVDAWKQWCGTSSVNGNCDSQEPPSNLELQQFSIRSKETLLRADGNSMPWQFVLTRAQRPPAPPDLLGNVTVHLEGNIFLIYHRAYPAS